MLHAVEIYLKVNRIVEELTLVLCDFSEVHDCYFFFRRALIQALSSETSSCILLFSRLKMLRTMTLLGWIIKLIVHEFVVT